jgi:hypothetical protein
MTRISTLCALVAAVALALAATAQADGPSIITSVQFDPPHVAPSVSAACGFTVLETETAYIRTLVFTDESGALVRYIAHVSFEGSAIDQSTGESLPWRGVWTQTLDVADHTLTIDGIRQEVIGADGSPAAMQVGHLVLPSSGSLTAIDESTRADFFDFFSNVCPAFS